jgi:HAD superfamily hydrolase (TIGR01549 family)
MTDAAVIFDVDGVLLELTDEEAELFFVPFETHLDASRLSRDWNSYRIRNDDDIVDEIMELYELSNALKPAIVSHYMSLLNQSINAQVIQTKAISGASQILSQLEGQARLGVATANFREAARLRLAAAGFWQHVSACAFGADGGGHKHQILARAVTALGLPKDRIVFIGDNLNDVEAGRRNGVHFIGFSEDQDRRASLAKAGAKHVVSNHTDTLLLIKERLAL